MDEDVEKKLAAEGQQQKGAAFKDVANETLRIGLLTERELKVTEPFKVKAHSMGVMPSLTYDRVCDVIEHLEGEHHA
jgi:hypothetical protein